MAQQRVMLKLVLVGDTGTGKTSLLNRWVNNRSSIGAKSTVGADFLSKDLLIDSSLTTLQLWDTAGQERFSSLGESFYRDTDAFGIVVTPKNLATVRQHYNKIKSYSSDAPIYFIVNKTDLFPNLDNQQLIENIKGQLPPDDKSAISISFCSAKDNDNIENAFRSMAADMLAYRNRVSQQQSEDFPPPIILSQDPFYSPSSSNPPWLLDIIANFIADHATWARGNAFLIIAAIIILVTLASLPIGGVPILFGLSVLAVAGIATGTAFLLWNLGCLIGNLWKGGGGGSSTLPGDDINKDWAYLDNNPSSGQQPQQHPEQYQKLHSDPPSPTPTQTGQPPIVNKKEL